MTCKEPTRVHVGGGNPGYCKCKEGYYDANLLACKLCHFSCKNCKNGNGENSNLKKI